MPSPIVNVTIQATLINLCSCIFATFFTGKQPPVIPLLIFTAFITPPNYLWQGYLEKVFPGYTTRKLNPDGADKEVKSEKKLNVGNTFIKFILDQTIATLVNVVAFLGGVAFLKGATVLECWHVVQQVGFFMNLFSCYWWHFCSGVFCSPVFFNSYQAKSLRVI